MTTRLAAAARFALPLLPALAVAGAAAAPPRQEFEFRCRLVRSDGTELAAPTATAWAKQPCRFSAGGTAPTLRPGVRLDYGTSLDAWAAPADGGKLLLDLTLSTTTLDADRADAVSVTGASVHTVRTVLPGEPVHLAFGCTSAVTLDLTVDTRSR